MAVIIDGLTYSTLGSLPKHADKSNQFLLVRLLTGSASVANGKATVKQLTDFSSLPPTLQTQKPSGTVADFLAAYSVGGDPKRFIRNTGSDNRKFYQDLLSEFSNFFLQTKLGCHTAAFVFAYRILEKLAYTVPLLYCSTQRDYIGTFNDLKALFDPSLKGELGLFKKFLNQGQFIDPLKLDINYTIDFHSEQGHQTAFFKVTVKHHTEFVNTDSNLSQVAIKFRQVPELLKTLRNRFFHSLTGEGRDNIRLEEIVDSDEYFASLNPVFCSFLSIVSLQTIAKKYQT